MLPTSQSGSFHFFTFRGINVSIHWMWFLAAAYFINKYSEDYRAPIWSFYEYFGLFAIVLLHEFGHAFACRQVGGSANRIVLWPLGGVAFVNPPQRPAPILWSIAAGPLVNVALIPVFSALVSYVQGSAWATRDVVRCAENLRGINFMLLAFNMLPAYPLDGGQILQSLLWFVMGRARSLYVTTVIGGLVGAYLIYFGLTNNRLITALMGFFMIMQCRAGFQFARQLSEFERAQRQAP